MKAIRRDKRNAWIAGVCAGIAKHLEINLTGTRLVTFIVFLFNPVLIGLAYLAAAYFMPLEDQDWNEPQAGERHYDVYSDDTRQRMRDWDERLHRSQQDFG